MPFAPSANADAIAPEIRPFHVDELHVVQAWMFALGPGLKRAAAVRDLLSEDSMGSCLYLTTSALSSISLAVSQSSSA